MRSYDTARLKEPQFLSLPVATGSLLALEAVAF
jgi:hypothetical protein